MLAAEEIAQMSRSERLETMELLWQSLTPDPALTPSPAWHQPFLEDREAVLQSGHAEWLSMEDLQRRLVQR